MAQDHRFFMMGLISESLRRNTVVCIIKVSQAMRSSIKRHLRSCMMNIMRRKIALWAQKRICSIMS